MSDDIVKGALLSPCGVYRYRLWRRWDKDLMPIAFVMLNPSTADAEEDDATIRRCIGFARTWSYGGIEVVNLFAYRTTDPRELRKARKDIVGLYNDASIQTAVKLSALVVCAWGNNSPTNRGEDVLRLLRDAGVKPLALAVTMRDQPGHPLRLAKTTLPFLWDKRND